MTWTTCPMFFVGAAVAISFFSGEGFVILSEAEDPHLPEGERWLTTMKVLRLAPRDDNVSFERRGAANDLGDFLRDVRLTSAVERATQHVQHLRRVVGRVLHRGALRPLET